MRTLSRGFRSFRRHWARNLVIIILLAVCLTFSLSMLAVKLAADQQVNTVKATVGNYAEVSVSSEALMAYFEQQRSMTESERNAQSRTMTDLEELLNRAENLVPEDVTDTFSKADEVRTYDKLLSASVTVSGLTSTEVTPLFQLREGSTSSASGNRFQFEGNTDAAALADFVDGQKTLTSGSLYTYADYKNANPVVIVEKNLAETNSLAVGDTIEASISGATGSNSKLELTVIGIYETVEAERSSDSSGGSQAMTNPMGSTLYAPLSVVQELNATPGYVSTGSYYFDSVDHTDQLQAAFSSQVGEDSNYALTTDESSYQSIADPLLKVSKTSLIGLGGALGACALIVLLAMGITIGSRTKELGVLKALGATNGQVIAQYAVEVVCITLVAIILAMGATTVIGQKLGNWMLSGNQASNSTQQTQQVAVPGGGNVSVPSGAPSGAGSGGMAFGQRLRNQVMNTSAQQQAASLQVVYRGSLFLWGILLLAMISLLGMAVPVIWIARIRPARILSME